MTNPHLTRQDDSAYPDTQVLPPDEGKPKKALSPWKRSKWIVTFVVLGAIGGWLTLNGARAIVDSIIDRNELNATVHQDQTTFALNTAPEVSDKIILRYKDKNGQLRRVLADKQSLSAFAKRTFPLLEQSRLSLRNQVKTIVAAHNKAAFTAMDKRVPDFADWYFAYATSYKILGEAITSAAQHALEPSATSLRDQVALDVERYFEEHFEKMVLRPELSDPILKRQFTRSAQKTHEQFLMVMAKLDEQFQTFVAENTTHMDKVQSSGITREIDWDSQFKKVTMAGHEKGAGGAARGAGLVVSGVLAGKAIGGALGKGVVGKMLASGIGKSLIAKISAPFVTKAVTVAGSTAVGAGTGAVGAGAATLGLGTAAGAAIGAAIGGVAGIGIDAIINKGIELEDRDPFERDTRLAIQSFENELNDSETTALQKAVDIWFNDTINLLKDFEE